MNDLFGNEEAKTSINPELKKLIDEAKQLEQDKTYLVAKTKDINKRLAEIGTAAQKMFEADGFPTFIMDGYKVSLALKNRWSVHDKAALLEAAKANENTAVFVKEELNKKFNGFLDEVLLSEGKIPFSDELVSLDYIQPSIEFKKAR